MSPSKCVNFTAWRWLGAKPGDKIQRQQSCVGQAATRHHQAKLKQGSYMAAEAVGVLAYRLARQQGKSALLCCVRWHDDSSSLDDCAAARQQGGNPMRRSHTKVLHDAMVLVGCLSPV